MPDGDGVVDRIRRALQGGTRFRRDDVAALLDAHDRLCVIMDAGLSYRDLEMKFRDGSFDLHAVLGEEGGSPATKWLAAIMLHAALGEDGVPEPPNYLSTVFEFGLSPAGEFGQVRAVLEVIKPGGKSSHEIRQDLEARIAALQGRG